ncbi:FkbM family methyltransferase [Spirosoma sp. BT702]|uniref:FkbM family methyltransferase n=1 Tax=Spirosoma profusum TaxID=2771354 RepID=A0A926XXK6_9BACT|nr:FkbM family methyltransferase [Spirosoma profusum]MBD2699633.1 FkbM family methyltransferase [Spirosoma profusum]
MEKYIDKIERLIFFLNNPSLSRWRKYEFDYKKYLQFKQKWFADFRFDTILDIGANTGQSAIVFALAFPEAKIHSFEPLPDCYVQLEKVTELFPTITAHNYALGDDVGEISFERNEYSPSSSLLKIAENHVKHFSNTKSVQTTQVPVVKLDEYAKNLDIKDNFLVKLDVQGYESKVIAGAEKTLKKAKVIILETSFEILYEDQPLFGDIYNKMVKLGFQYSGSFDQLISPINDKIVQQDAIFINTSL